MDPEYGKDVIYQIQAGDYTDTRKMVILKQLDLQNFKDPIL